MKNEIKFEEKLKELEQIINELENGEIDLEDSIVKYTRAMNLVNDCDKKLKNINGANTVNGFGGQIRSYVFHPYSLVKDARTGFETANANGVLDGELDGLVDAYLHYNKK